jgi:hypothetical protein
MARDIAYSLGRAALPVLTAALFETTSHDYPKTIIKKNNYQYAWPLLDTIALTHFYTDKHQNLGFSTEHTQNDLTPTPLEERVGASQCPES